MRDHETEEVTQELMDSFADDAKAQFLEMVGDSEEPLAMRMMNGKEKHLLHFLVEYEKVKLYVAELGITIPALSDDVSINLYEVNDSDENNTIH